MKEDLKQNTVKVIHADELCSAKHNSSYA
jgi:hypothetical protein